MQFLLVPRQGLPSRPRRVIERSGRRSAAAPYLGSVGHDRSLHTLTPTTSRRARPIRGEARVAGDKSISHRALMLGALAIGETAVSGLLEGDDGHANRMGGEGDKGGNLIEDVSELGEDEDEKTKVATAMNDGG